MSIDLTTEGANNLAGSNYALVKLVTDYAIGKDLISINYKTDLKSGVRLQPTIYYTNDGLIDNVIYTYNGQNIIKVSEVYEYNAVDLANNDIMMSKKGIHGRVKKWEYYYENGSICQNVFKERQKFYLTDIEGLDVGVKRRHNIQIILSERAGTMLVILGIFTGSKEVKDEMRRLSKVYSVGFNEYEKYGTEDILNDIQNDTSASWLNSQIPTNADLLLMKQGGVITEIQMNQMMGAIGYYNLYSLQGFTFREYFIKKLKGEIE